MQSGSITWPSVLDANFVMQNRESLQFYPVFLQRTTAGCQFHALEQACSELSFAKLAELSNHLKCVVLSIESDSAASLMRSKFHIGSLVDKHNSRVYECGGGVIIFVDVRCVAHALHNLVERTFRHKSLIPRLFYTAWISKHTASYANILTALETIVHEDFNVGFFPGSRPPEQGRSVRESLMELTVFGQHEDIRARQHMPPSDKSMEILDELAAVCNGDWSANYLQHFCYGPTCCAGGNREVSEQRMVGILMSAFFGQLGTDIPSTSRWSTVAPTCARQCGAMACHNILGRVMARALDTSNAPVNDEDEYHALVTQRTAACLDFVTDQPSSLKLVLSATVLGIPVQVLSSRLQHLDATSGAAVELTKHCGPIEQCMIDLWSAVFSEERFKLRQYLAAGMEIVSSRGGSTFDYIESVRNDAVHLSATVWLLHLRFKNWPWKLLSGHLMNEEEKRELYEEFANAPACCLDEWWSTPLRAAYPDAKSYLDDPQLRQLLVTLASHLKGTNMLLEGLISEVRSASPGGHNFKVQAERLQHVGCLQLFLKDHLKAGRADPRQRTSNEVASHPTGIPKTKLKTQTACVGFGRGVGWEYGPELSDATGLYFSSMWRFGFWPGFVLASCAFPRCLLRKVCLSRDML